MREGRKEGRGLGWCTCMATAPIWLAGWPIGRPFGTDEPLPCITPTHCYQLAMNENNNKTEIFLLSIQIFIVLRGLQLLEDACFVRPLN